MPFKTEKEFEDAVVKLLGDRGYDKNILINPTEQDLIQNWADILFENNQVATRLGNYPLTTGEMDQLLEQIREARTPCKLHEFINGGTVTITRDNEDDKVNFGHPVSLKIYDADEIAAGQSRYQIARQPKFHTNGKLPDRRGDLTLLINGMPVIHIELKNEGVSVMDASYQIKKYSQEGVFSGLFSLVQIFVAMTPIESVYFANPGPDGEFKPEFFFHWGNSNNDPINQWDEVVDKLLSIPMAHQMIGYYTVADQSSGILKVMRSYQYVAASRIADKVAKYDWKPTKIPAGGFVWHTTGSGKTMTSFKSAQLIANSQNADKVIFLLDRIELGQQSFNEYKSFASDKETVYSTENTNDLVKKLSEDKGGKLIVTSIQKLSRINEESDKEGIRDAIKKIASKRLVIIIDECHRSTFGEMLTSIKKTFPKAIYFGFTGTPIHKENQKKLSTTTTLFGNEICRYSIADGIRDHNVLGFDPCMVLTYKDKDLREQVALSIVKEKSVEDVYKSEDAKKIDVYRRLTSSLTPMAGYEDADGKYVKGIEDYVPTAQYSTDRHRKKVVEHIKDNWLNLSQGKRFHGLFSANSIEEAVAYYHVFKDKTDLKVNALFDPSIDNVEKAFDKESSLLSLLEDYNKEYGVNFSLSNYDAYKKDVCARLAHKHAYKNLEKGKEIDLLIVVNQLLTGFDSPWINTLYLDRLLEYENLIQAFSRTNRLFGPEKPFGNIRYYRKPHTMKSNIEKAVKLYSGDKPLGLFVDHLLDNILHINQLFDDIASIFKSAGIENFASVPKEPAYKKEFVKKFNELTGYLEAARIQGFTWDKSDYSLVDEDTGETKNVTSKLSRSDFKKLQERYIEILQSRKVDPDPHPESIPFDINPYLMEFLTGTIDADYMNSKFEKYRRLLVESPEDKALLQEACGELHKTFAELSHEDQKYAMFFLHAVEDGIVKPDPNKTFRDYLNEAKVRALDMGIKVMADRIGVDALLLDELIKASPSAENVNEFGRFDRLMQGIDLSKSQNFLEAQTGKRPSPFGTRVLIQKLLRNFILQPTVDEEIMQESVKG